ncbi:unnamed protein product [Scytosiphon promiscuus]
MAIFSNGSAGRTSKRTTPRGSGNLFVASSTPSQQRSESLGSFAPEKTGGNNISPSHSVTLNSMESTATATATTAAQSKPPTGRAPLTLLDQKPESMVAETLRMKGELEFTRLLRVDGRFEGELITDKGSLVVGPKGEVIGDLKNMQEVYVEGVVRGNVFANDVKIKNNGMLLGDIQCICLTLDPTASIKGVADTATLKERAILDANPAPPSSSSSSGTAAAPSTGAAPAPSSGAAAGSGAPVVAAGVAASSGETKGTDVIPAATAAEVAVEEESTAVAVEETNPAPSPSS